MREELETIIEVQECGQHLANHLLKHEYVLLDIQTATRAQRYPEGGSNQGSLYYIRRNPIYVLGRPESVERAPLMPRYNPDIENSNK